MSPNQKSIKAVSNVYTALVGIATMVVAATAVFVAVMGITHYDTFIKIVEASR